MLCRRIYVLAEALLVTLRTLRAYEPFILQNTMLIHITLLAYIFLEGLLTLQKVLGIIMVFIGVLIVQLSPR